MRRLPSKEMTLLVRAAEGQGYRVARTGSGHVKVTAPGGASTVVASSPGSRGAIHKARARLRAIGVTLP